MNYDPIPGKILCLDLARVSGWSAGRKGDDPPAMGAIEIPTQMSYGRKLMAAENAIIDLIEFHRPARVIAEAPLSLGAQHNNATARWLFGILAYAHGEAARYGIDLEEVRADDVRMAVLGQARITKDEKARGLTMKDIAMRYCRLRRWEPPTHDAADAAIMFHYVTTRLG